MTRVLVDVEVCPACLGPVTGGDPECWTCRPEAGEFRPLMLVAEGRGEWRPATRPTWGWDGGDPGDPGGWDGDVFTVRRHSEDGEFIASWDDLPTSTQELIMRLLAEAAEMDDSALCAAEDRADARREEDSW